MLAAKSGKIDAAVVTCNTAYGSEKKEILALELL